MTELVELTDAEIEAVAGGTKQIINIYATQSNSSTVTQTASATNSGSVSATAGAGGTAAAAGAESSNIAMLSQANLIVVTTTVAGHNGHHQHHKH